MIENSVILVLNCGSSTLKYSLFDIQLNKIANGLVDKIGFENSVVIQKFPGGTDKDTKEFLNIPDHTNAIEYILKNKLPQVIDISKIIAVGHRVVHGGDKYNKPVIVNEAVIQEIKKCFDLAPLHNPHHLKGINAIIQHLPKVPNMAVFDTAFHQTIPEKAFLYALPYHLYKKLRIRKYGFHGISHEYVAQKTAEILGMDLFKLKLITCHLGNGCSIAAIRNGGSIETSMGFTPLAGLMMGTRCGDIDPAIVGYLMVHEGIAINEINNLMNNQSGILGISGISNDFRTILEESSRGNDRASLALDMFCYRIKKYIGEYYAVLDGIDALVFTAGIGENSALVRSMVCRDLTSIGISLSDESNTGSDPLFITDKDSKTKVLVIHTDEELMIAKQVKKLFLELS